MGENLEPVKTGINATLTIRPVGDILGNITGLVADYAIALLSMFYPTAVARKANVAISELVTNVLENISDPGGVLSFALNVEGERLRVSVTNTVNDEQFQKVVQRISDLKTHANPRKLLAETIRARRVHQLKGGLGLIRLVAENKFELSAEKNGDELTVHAVYRLEATT